MDSTIRVSKDEQIKRPDVSWSIVKCEMANDGLMMCLRDFVQGSDWLRLTSTCKDFRRYALWNRKLSCRYPRPPIQGKIQNLPLGLTCMEIGCSITAKKIILPETLTHLVINFNNRVNNWKLPDGLTSLTLGDEFNRAVEGWSLPESLEELHVGSGFNHPVTKWALPSKLRVLKFSMLSRVSVVGWVLPDSIQYLECWCNFYNHFCVWKLPIRLKTFIVRGRTNYLDMDCLELPEGLESFAVKADIHFNIKGLPKMLKVLCVGGRVEVDGEKLQLPQNFKVLGVEDIRHCDLDSITFPDGILCIALGGIIRKEMCGSVHDEIINFWKVIGGKHDMLHLNTNHLKFPNSVEVITFGSNFHGDLTRLYIPTSLKEVRVGMAIRKPPFLYR